jgi:hypothetical protein
MLWTCLFRLIFLVTPPGAPPPNTPLEAPPRIVNAWLLFHETGLCQELDARFVFHPKGLEVWCVVQDEKAFEKFMAILEPLHPDFDVEVYPTRPPQPKKQADAREPLPSLWNNSELRDYLRTSPDIFGRAEMRQNAERDPDYFMKQRMILFADQTIDYQQKMARFGSDLPSLVYAGLAAGMTSDLRARSAAVALQHALELHKYASRLGENLQQALPKPSGKNRARPDPEKPQGLRLSPIESALQLARLAQNTGRRIYRFLNPQRHTVDLTDLKEPGLLESIRRVRDLSSELRESVKQSARR